MSNPRPDLKLVLQDNDAWREVVAFVKTHAKDCVAEGAPLQVQVTQARQDSTKEPKRTLAQNAKLRAVLEDIAQQAVWNGQQFPVSFWTAYFTQKYLLKEQFVSPSGDTVNVYWSTADLSKAKFSAFLEQVLAEVAVEFALVFP